eukprot:TRINITY_DN23419_c0_g1_i1.p1 TRINITY_DN23419_c0_g1~~TRINITY_DN23419_c0_g1_i1.p1  ORF type:complete len:326 (+),score=93.42 TRINITY_DN23419_c0_g1_i1:240-1217(+)
MDFLKSMVDDKKRKMTSEKDTSGKKKFQRRGAIREAAEAAAKPAEAVAEKPVWKMPVPVKQALGAALSPKSPSTEIISREDAVRMLRKLREPIQLFGETDAERSARVKRLQERYGVHDDDMNIGQTNDRLDGMESKRLEQEALLRKKPKKKEEEPSAPATPATPVGIITVEGMVARWIQNSLREWEEVLEKRSDKDKLSVWGKDATSTQKQCQRYMKPLLNMLENQTCSATILSKLSNMIGLIDKLEYQKASDVYLRLCIGNAPWPIGATSVGIHERAGRTRIFEGNVAHVMGDENTRKYLQSFKRLMTFMQSLRPNPDPIKNMG